MRHILAVVTLLLAAVHNSGAALDMTTLCADLGTMDTKTLLKNKHLKIALYSGELAACNTTHASGATACAVDGEFSGNTATAAESPWSGFDVEFLNAIANAGSFTYTIVSMGSAEEISQKSGGYTAEAIRMVADNGVDIMGNPTWRVTASRVDDFVWTAGVVSEDSLLITSSGRGDSDPNAFNTEGSFLARYTMVIWIFTWRTWLMFVCIVVLYSLLMLCVMRPPEDDEDEDGFIKTDPEDMFHVHHGHRVQHKPSAFNAKPKLMHSEVRAQKPAKKGSAFRPTSAAHRNHKHGNLELGSHHQTIKSKPSRRASLLFGASTGVSLTRAEQMETARMHAKTDTLHAPRSSSKQSLSGNVMDTIIGEGASYAQDGDELTRSEVFYHSCVSITGEHGISAETPLQRAIGCGWIFFIFMMTAVYTAALTAYASREFSVAVPYATIFECIEDSENCLFCLQKGSANAGFFKTDDAYNPGLQTKMVSSVKQQIESVLDYNTSECSAAEVTLEDAYLWALDNEDNTNKCDLNVGYSIVRRERGMMTTRANACLTLAISSLYHAVKVDTIQVYGEEMEFDDLFNKWFTDEMGTDPFADCTEPPPTSLDKLDNMFHEDKQNRTGALGIPEFLGVLTIMLIFVLGTLIAHFIRHPRHVCNTLKAYGSVCCLCCCTASKQRRAHTRTRKGITDAGTSAFKMNKPVVLHSDVLTGSSDPFFGRTVNGEKRGTLVHTKEEQVLHDTFPQATRGQINLALAQSGADEAGAAILLSSEEWMHQNNGSSFFNGTMEAADSTSL